MVFLGFLTLFALVTKPFGNESEIISLHILNICELIGSNSKMSCGEQSRNEDDSDANADGKSLVDTITNQEADVDAADLIESEEVKEALERIKKESK